LQWVSKTENLHPQRWLLLDVYKGLCEVLVKIRQVPTKETAMYSNAKQWADIRHRVLDKGESINSVSLRERIHGSNYETREDAVEAINLYFEERNANFRASPRPAGNKIWGKERTPSQFSSSQNCKDQAYR
jgi:hypothetical protein